MARAVATSYRKKLWGTRCRRRAAMLSLTQPLHVCPPPLSFLMANFVHARHLTSGDWGDLSESTSCGRLAICE